MKISIVAAVSENGVIGDNGKLPWHLPLDLKNFKKITKGHHVVMGRKTFESIGRPLPGRENIVVTRNKNYKKSRVKIVHSIKGALQLAKYRNENEVMIIGGEQIYKKTLSIANKIYMTKIQGNFKGDAFFPKLNKGDWKITSKKSFPNFEFQVLERK